MTHGSIEAPEQWLRRENQVCRPGRLCRLRWLADNTPSAEYYTFPGGLMSKHLFEEARYSFAYGQFLATIVLGLAYIEHTLAGLLYAAGRDDLERAGIGRLLREALRVRWIGESEFQNLQRARKARNPVTHFRKPGSSDTV